MILLGAFVGIVKTVNRKLKFIVPFSLGHGKAPNIGKTIKPLRPKLG